MNSFLFKPFSEIIPIKYLCDISYNITDKRIFIHSNDRLFCMEDYRNEMENCGCIPKGLNVVDTVIFNEKSASLIEFKSGIYGNISTKLLKDQFIDSKTIISNIRECYIDDFKCIIVIEMFVYHISENLKRLKSNCKKNKPQSTLLFLKERISNINVEIKKNKMHEIEVLFASEFIQKYNINLCDIHNTCVIKPKIISKCEFKN